MPKEKPLIFTGPMVQAILDNRKSMTRRMAYRSCRECNGRGFRKPYTPTHSNAGITPECPKCGGDGGFPSHWQKCQPGDLLWVREAWTKFAPHHVMDGKLCAYKADSNDADGEEIRQEFIRCGYDYRWKSPIYMPRWASRITLEVTETRIERVQDISEEDAKAEGVGPWEGKPENPAFSQGPAWYRIGFEDIWTSLHPPGPKGWHSNPWVVVVSFKKVA